MYHGATEIRAAYKLAGCSRVETRAEMGKKNTKPTRRGRTFAVRPAAQAHLGDGATQLRLRAWCSRGWVSSRESEGRVHGDGAVVAVEAVNQAGAGGAK
jgi:hypothetical protein